MKLRIIITLLFLGAVAQAQVRPSFLGHRSVLSFKGSFMHARLSPEAYRNARNTESPIIFFNSVSYERLRSRNGTWVISAGASPFSLNLGDHNMVVEQNDRSYYYYGDQYISAMNYHLSYGFRNYYQNVAPVGKYVGIHLRYNRLSTTLDETAFQRRSNGSSNVLLYGVDTEREFTNNSFQLELETGHSWLINANVTIDLGLTLKLPFYPLFRPDRDVQDDGLTYRVNRFMPFSHYGTSSLLIDLRIGWMH
ncbi:MAG: hypothetical protein HWD92_04825 [Flavobacteriia bacterium]|nr:hypothetical protein [Flavobacteriia bacterium]